MEIITYRKYISNSQHFQFTTRKSWLWSNLYNYCFLSALLDPSSTKRLAIKSRLQYLGPTSLIILTIYYYLVHSRRSPYPTRTVQLHRRVEFRNNGRQAESFWSLSCIRKSRGKGCYPDNSCGISRWKILVTFLYI